MRIAGISKVTEDSRDGEEAVTRSAAVSRALDRAGFAIIARGSQHCVAEGGQAAGDREQMRARLEKLFLFLV